jgi:uncharacterized membrane protein YphA (DoxX/SURF4 family)
MNFKIGSHVYGVAAIVFGVLAFVWHDLNAPWQQIRPLGNVPHRELLVYVAAAIFLLGGVAIQIGRTARIGALALGGIYLFFALMWVPFIVAEPRSYDRWGNFFEQFSLVSGALIVYAELASDRQSATRLARVGYWGFAVCVVSFMLEQAFYLQATASFVPKWIPPGQMFWAVATTVFFALAAIALFTGRSALLAARLLTAMMVGFGLLVWLPAPFANPHQMIGWAGNAQNLAITGAAWIVADYLGDRQIAQRSR